MILKELKEKLNVWKEVAKEVDLSIIYLNEVYAWQPPTGEAVGRAWEKLFEAQDKMRALLGDAAMGDNAEPTIEEKGGRSGLETNR